MCVCVCMYKKNIEVISFSLKFFMVFRCLYKIVIYFVTLNVQKYN